MVQFVKKILTQTNSPSFESYLRYANKVYDLDIKINKSKRVHRITLRVCQFSGELRLTVPPLIRVGAFSNFIEQHLDWINLQKAKIIKQIQIAEGIKTLILDVKFGNGAFMGTKKDAQNLGEILKSVGEKFNIGVYPFYTNMDQPLGNSCGLWCEIQESIECLKGQGPKDLMEIVTYLAINTLKKLKISDPQKKN